VKHLHMLDRLIDELSRASSKEEGAELLSQLMEVSLKEGLSEQDIVNGIVVALEKRNSFARPAIWRLFRYLDMNSWEYLTSKQQAFVKDYLRIHWGTFSDWMSTFVACEILGAREPKEEMLLFFQNAALTIPSPQNALACYGIQKVAESTTDNNIVSKSLAILKTLEKHPDKGIEQEARQALENISRKSA
jgi:hypothetical protein